MGERFRDFDAQFAEMRQEMIRIRVYGKDYLFPAVIPAYIPLEMAKYTDADGIPSHVMLGAARVLFGDQALGDWSAHQGFDMAKLGLIIREAFEMINGKPEADEDETEDDMGPLA